MRAHHQLNGREPGRISLILTTGMMTLIFLLLRMAVTPLRKITGLELAYSILAPDARPSTPSFTPACISRCFFSLDRGFSVSSTCAISEMVKRKYLIVGGTGLLVMLPLAITSTNGMIKRLGGKRWRELHRLALTVAAICGAIHYYMQVKADVRQPLVFAAVLAVLLGALAWWFTGNVPSPRRQRQPNRSRRS